MSQRHSGAGHLTRIVRVAVEFYKNILSSALRQKAEDWRMDVPPPTPLLPHPSTAALFLKPRLFAEQTVQHAQPGPQDSDHLVPRSQGPGLKRRTRTRHNGAAESKAGVLPMDPRSLGTLGTLAPSCPKAHRERTALRFWTKNGPWASVVQVTWERVTGCRESRARQAATRVLAHADAL